MMTHLEKKQAEALSLSIRRAIFVWEAIRMLEKQRMLPTVAIPRPWGDLDLELRMQFVGSVERQCGDPQWRDPAVHPTFLALCEIAGDVIKE